MLAAFFTYVMFYVGAFFPPILVTLFGVVAVISVIKFIIGRNHA